MQPTLHDSPTSEASRPQDPFEVVVGQCNDDPAHGAPATWCAYAGLGTEHLLVITDGAAGTTPSRLAAEVCARAIVSAFRAQHGVSHKGRLEGALTEAAGAVRRATVDTELEGRVRVDTVAVLLARRHVIIARTGQAEAWVMSGDTPVHWAGLAAPQGTESASVVQHPRPSGGVLTLMSPDAARVLTAADVIVASRRPPQHAAQSLAEIARKRGASRGVAIQVVAPDGERSLSETQLLPRAPGAWGVKLRRHLGRFAVGAILGGLTALLLHAPTPDAPQAPIPIQTETGDVDPRACFGHPDAAAAADALLHALVQMGARERTSTQDALLRWLRAHPSRHHAQILLSMLDKAPPPAVAAWIHEALMSMLPGRAPPRP